MPWYDFNGATNNRIRSVYDFDGVTNHRITAAYDFDGTTNRANFYPHHTIHPGVTPITRSTTNSGAGTFYAYANNTNSPGASGCAYVSLDITAWRWVEVAFTCPVMITYGALMVGVGNFSSYDISMWPTITHGLGWDTICSKNGYIAGYTGTLNIDVQNMSGTIQVGCAATARSSIEANGRINITSLVLKK